MSAYEQKRQERAERLRDRAAKKLSEAVGLRSQNQKIAEVMNGTPVLRGHHSEGRHRRDLDRMDRRDRKAFSLYGEAKDLERRARAAERNTTISSDDPEALVKLRAKLEQETADRDEMKRLNAVHRKGGWEAVAAEVGTAEAVKLRRRALSIAEDVPYPRGSVSNATANLRRIQERIKVLEEAAAAPDVEPVRIGPGVIEEEENRTRIRFDGKPSPELRQQLKRHGFRWAPSLGVWQRHASPFARRAAEELLRKAEGGAA